MTGLEGILKSISDEAKSIALQTIEQANKEAKEIISLSVDKANNEAKKIIEKAEYESKKLKEKEMSSAKLERKKIILKAKQEHINNLINDAKNSIRNLEDKDYFTVILKMIEKFATKESGEIIFSKKDKSRLTEDFLNELNRITSLKGSNLKVSKQTRNIDGGFILVYGGVEENCSLDALFDSAHDTLCDSVNKLLFP